MKKYKNPIDEAIARTLEKPDDDSLHGKLFEYLHPVSPPSKRNYCPVCGDEIDLDADFCSDGCMNIHSSESEVEIDEEDCPDEDDEIEMILKEEKKGKCY